MAEAAETAGEHFISWVYDTLRFLCLSRAQCENSPCATSTFPNASNSAGARNERRWSENLILHISLNSHAILQLNSPVTVIWCHIQLTQ